MKKNLKKLKIAMVAGEASGDLLGAGLIQALKKQYAGDVEVFGIAGDKMIDQGAQSWYSMERLSVVGLIEPLKRLPELIKIRRALYRRILEKNPDVFIGIDAPEFNLGLEVKLKKAGIKVIHYVSPSVWAWRKRRIHKIKRAVDLMLTLFPFETSIYEQHHIPVKFVGHPLADQIPLKPDSQKAREQLGLPLNKPILAILPGSRSAELENLGGIFIETAKRCLEQIPDLQIITAMPNLERFNQMQQLILASQLPIKNMINQSHQVMKAADVLLLGAGTVTLEAMLLKRPMVVAYRFSKVTYQLLKRLVKIKHFSLPNLILEEGLVPELIQDEVNPEKLTPLILKMLTDTQLKNSLIKKFTIAHKQLKQNASETAARMILGVKHRFTSSRNITN